MNSKEYGVSRTWICDRCLTLSLSIQELLRTVKILSESKQSLEAANVDLSGRLELLESHGTPKRVNVEDPASNMDEETGSDVDETSVHDTPKNVAMAHARPRTRPKVKVPKSQWGALNKRPEDLPYIYPKNPNFTSGRGRQRANEEMPRHPSEGPKGHTTSPQQGIYGKMEIHVLRGSIYSFGHAHSGVYEKKSPLENEHCSPNMSHSFFRHLKRHASTRTSSKTRRSSKASHPTSISTTSQCPHSSTNSRHATIIPPTHGSFV